MVNTLLYNAEKQSNYAIPKPNQNAMFSNVSKYLLRSVKITFPDTVMFFIVMFIPCSFSGIKHQSIDLGLCFL